MANTEKPTELAVRDWLKLNTTFGGVTRPAKDPPDYLVGSGTAVEVTELHQQVRGVPERSIGEPVWDTVRDVFKDKSPKPSLGRLGFHCEYSLEAPPKKKELQRELKEALQDFIDENRRIPIRPSERRYWNEIRHRDDPMEPLHICLPCGLCVDFWPVSGPPGFVPLAHGPETGTLALTELMRSAAQAIPAKTSSAERVAALYPGHQWWLVLVDQIPLGRLTEWELEAFAKALSVPPFWSRVLFFDRFGQDHQVFPF